MGIDANQILRRIQIALIHAEDHGHFLITGDCRHTVNQKRLCDRIGIGGKNHQCVDIGNRGPNKAITAGMNFLHHSLAPFNADGNHISGQGDL